MVQYDEDKYFDEDMYWKIVPLIQDFTKWPREYRTDTREFMTYSRQQRGMLIYDRCTAEELRTFCTSRGLECPKKARTISQVAEFRKTCTDRLENLDDNGCLFARFLDLPPELRVRIYQWYKSSLVLNYISGYRGGRPPPITAVSRLVQTESLPVFCELFDFDYERERGPNGADDSVLKMDWYKMEFFERHSETVCRTIRQLHIYCGYSDGLDCFPWDDWKWTVDLREKVTYCRVSFDSADIFAAQLPRKDNEDGKRALTEKMKAIREALKNVADELATRSPLAVREEDTKRILKALTAG